MVEKGPATTREQERQITKHEEKTWGLLSSTLREALTRLRAFGSANLQNNKIIFLPKSATTDQRMTAALPTLRLDG